MILFFGMLLLPLGYGGLYLYHSVRKSRRGQAAAIGALLLLCTAAAALLLWEFYRMP